MVEEIEKTVRYAVKVPTNHVGDGWTRTGLRMDDILTLHLDGDGVVKVREADGYAVVLLQGGKPFELELVQITAKK